MMTDNDRRLARHVGELAAAFGVQLVVCVGMPPEQAGAGLLRDKPFIKIAPVIDESTYAVGLHELGHCLSPTGMLHAEMSNTMRTTQQFSSVRDVMLKLEEERAAWRWAQHYALEWTPLMTYVKVLSLDSYERTARRLVGRRRVP